MHSDEKSLSITVNNLTVSYYNEGAINLQTIIFIHGFPLNKMMWKKQIELLKDHYHVIAYDIRGHGNTDTGNDDFSIGLFVNDLLTLMDILKIDKAILCGFSMGGYIALEAIKNYPGRFNALILCDTNCATDTSEVREKRMKTTELVREKGVEQYAEESLKKLFALISFSTHTEEIAIVREMIMNTSGESITKTLYALAERNETCTNLYKVKVPVLIMVGREDEITPPAVAIQMHEQIKGSTIHIIDHAGHISNMENPIEFNIQLAKFLSLIKLS